MSRTAVWVAAALASVATFAVAVPVKTETVKYQAGDKAMVGYLAYPAERCSIAAPSMPSPIPMPETILRAARPTTPRRIAAPGN